MQTSIVILYKRYGLKRICLPPLILSPVRKLCLKIMWTCFHMSSTSFQSENVVVCFYNRISLWVAFCRKTISLNKNSTTICVKVQYVTWKKVYMVMNIYYVWKRCFQDACEDIENQSKTKSNHGKPIFWLFTNFT